MLDPQIVICQHIARALAAELTDRWIDASDAWLDAWVVAIKADRDVEASGYLANSRAADKVAAAGAEDP
jgi:hypothetical protein